MRLNLILLAVGLFVSSSAPLYAQARKEPVPCELPPPLICPPPRPDKPHPSISEIDSYIDGVSHAILVNESVAKDRETERGEAETASKYAKELKEYKGELIEYRSQHFNRERLRC
jgi:hypothetical protein